MTWEKVCEDPALQDLPFKIELTEWGKIEMSPARNRHSEYQGEIEYLLRTLKKGGLAFPECGVQTKENVKVADVAWVSFERRRATPHEFAYAVAPEICVEVISPTNTLEEQLHKGRLYLQAGAVEFWLCSELGDLRFFDASGPLERSRLCPDFPAKVVPPES